MQIAKELAAAAEELISIAKPKKGQIFVLGCSTSEVLGNKIGTGGSSETAVAMFKALKAVCDAHELYLAVQCCEHLNRSLVVEAATAERYNLEEVTVRPVAHAGGAMATAAYENFAEPVVVEKFLPILELILARRSSACISNELLYLYACNIKKLAKQC